MKIICARVIILEICHRAEKEILTHKTTLSLIGKKKDAIEIFIMPHISHS